MKGFVEINSSGSYFTIRAGKNSRYVCLTKITKGDLKRLQEYLNCIIGIEPDKNKTPFKL